MLYGLITCQTKVSF